MFPEDEQTRKDFGFDKVRTLTDMKSLIAVYYGILVILKVSTRKIHQWQLDNQLAKHIKIEFETKTPENNRPDHYVWLLTNEHLLDQSLPALNVPDIWERAWASIGSSDKKSGPEIKNLIEEWPERKKESFILYTVLLSGAHPQPDNILWLRFGFCVCHGDQEEDRLAKLYISLIERCTFEEFWLSFNSAVLPGLFVNKGLSQELDESGHLKVLLSLSPTRIHSVWLLKQLVYTDHNEANKAVAEDYGFANCSTTKKFIELKKVYKQLFDCPKVDEMDLDRARLAGRVYVYVSGLIDIEPKHERLMKNRYPMEDGQSEQET